MRLNSIIFRALLVAMILCGCRRPQIERAHESPTPIASPTAARVPTPTPPVFVPNKRMEVSKLFNGLEVRTTLETLDGGKASVERESASSYALDLQVRVRVPKANDTVRELAELNSNLPTLLPTLEELTKRGKVSSFYGEIYRLKVKSIHDNLERIDQLISRHNFYDCETVLELQDAGTSRRALLIQAEMDVDTDGSDSDRVPLVDAASSTFKPMTSYKWPKKTAVPNPFLAGREEKLKQTEKEAAVKTLSAEKRSTLKAEATDLQNEVADLKKSSFLVAATDPYIVLPGSLMKTAGAFAPRVGDYCVVIYKDVIYPAIVGDVGPRDKIGEASVRLSKEINARSNGNNRPVNDLKVTYLVFPNTADKPFAPPDLEKWHARCHQFLNEIGGYKGELHLWENLIKPPATPAPSPSPSPASSPSASPSPVASPSPAVSPSPTPARA